MGKDELLSKIKHIAYKAILPLYLWSIGFKTLDDYITEIENQYKRVNNL